MHKGFLFSISMLVFLTSCVLDDSHTNKYEMILIVVLIFISLMLDDQQHLLYVVFGNLYIFLGKMSIPLLCPLLHWIVCFLAIKLYIPYIFWILTPYQTYGLICLMGCLFILLIVSFALQKIFSFYIVPMLSFAFVAFTFGVISKKIIAKT